jgi:hypothetical protein
MQDVTDGPGSPPQLRVLFGETARYDSAPFELLQNYFD